MNVFLVEMRFVVLWLMILLYLCAKIGTVLSELNFYRYYFIGLKYMKKGVWLLLGALILVGGVVVAIWYLGEKKEMQTGNKEAFIPYNSAVVVCVNSKPQPAQELLHALDEEFIQYRQGLLARMADSLRKNDYVVDYPYVMAFRVQGKEEISVLYVIDHKQMFSKNETADYLNKTFAVGIPQVRKYDRYKIYTLKQQKEVAYFSICGNFILLSDSDLYVEDALKQFEQGKKGEPILSQYQQLNKYFSVGAGINLFLNTSAFTDLIPLFLQSNRIFPHLDVRQQFRWGALDGEWNKEGIYLNGFLSDAGLNCSYLQVLERQQPRKGDIDDVVPNQIAALGMLNFSDLLAYFSDLEEYRYAVGKKNSVFERKQQYVKMFGKRYEQELQELLQGEFAIVDLGYERTTQEMEGLVIATLKSGSLGKQLLEEMMQNYARFDKKEEIDYQREYRMDQQKSFPYYCFSVLDFPEICWGDPFQCVKSRYVLVEDNYWIFASSEEAVRHFIRDYVHGSSIRSMDWYKKLKMRLAGKDNLAYFARSAELLPKYKEVTLNSMQRLIKKCLEKTPFFPSWALQWSNEGEMIYNTLFLNSEPLSEEIRPHVVWQTRLGGEVCMKPVSVVNHVTGERELFVQDKQNTIYLINDAGRILWKQLVDGKINSEVYQVDLFKNGKLQYLFSTPSKLYLIDRNGDAVQPFPLTFRATCEQGITLCDYDQNRQYRVFVPCIDQQVYLYGLDGQLVKGWEPQKADNPIVTRVRHVRLAGKDYIVFADRHRLYILDRKGKERVKVTTMFDLSEQTELHLLRQGDDMKLVFLGQEGIVFGVDFKGKVSHFQVDGVPKQAGMNVADVNGDGRDECILAAKNQFLITQSDGKLLGRYTLDAEELESPYVYQFSKVDCRIGLMDEKQSCMYLLTPDGKMSKGFPISGDSPFSIVYAGNNGFFLYVGTNGDSLIKYRVQR